MKKYFALLLVSAFFLSGCVTSEQLNSVYSEQRSPTAQERAAASESLSKTLYDPYSARDVAISNVLFPSRILPSSQNAKAVCVRLNAKNRFGAYTGLSYFMLKYNAAGSLISMDDSPLAQTQCNDNRLGYSRFPELDRL